MPAISATKQGNPGVASDQQIEAARYALLRRLAPALRHNMAGGLQPISMIAAMLEKRLLSASPDLAIIAKNAAAMNSLSREAAASCMDLMTWLAPKDNAMVPASAGIADAIALIATDLSFRGFELVNETTDEHATVARNALRNALMAALITLTDTFKAPASVRLTPQLEPEAGVIVIDINLVKSESDIMKSSGLSAYRALDWTDVEALAQADGVVLAHTDSHALLRFQVQTVIGA